MYSAVRNEGFSVQVRCDLANVDCHIPACECAACHPVMISNKYHVYVNVLK